MLLDAFGKACPIPLMMAKEQLDRGVLDLQVKVDNETAVKNLTRLGEKSGFEVAVENIEGGFLVSISKIAGAQADAAAPAPVVASSCGTAGCGYSVFVGKDHVGDGDPQLGRNLMKMALFTLAQDSDAPASVLFMNSGVKLVAGEEPQVVESCQALAAKGTEILVCGTCLNFYGVAEQLAVGEVSNMYDILTRMKKAAKVITL